MSVAALYFQVVAHIHQEVGTILNLIVQKLPKRTLRLSRIIWLCSILTTLLVKTRYFYDNFYREEKIKDGRFAEDRERNPARKEDQERVEE